MARIQQSSAMHAKFYALRYYQNYVCNMEIHTCLLPVFLQMSDVTPIADCFFLPYKWIRKIYFYIIERFTDI